MKKQIYLLFLFLIFINMDIKAQESESYILKLIPEIKASGSVNQVIQFTITEGDYQIPSGQITDSEGNILTAQQRNRLQEIIDNDMFEFLGLTIQSTYPFLPQLDTTNTLSGVSEDYALPMTLTIPQNVLITANPTSWSGDNDTARFVFDSRDENNTYLTRLVDTGHQNWSSTGYDLNGVVREYTGVMPVGAARARFYAECYKYTGSICSAAIGRAAVVFNHDLPEVGEVIEINTSL